VTFPNPPCTAGTRPKSGTPEWFFWDPIQLPIPFADLSRYLTAAILGLSTSAVRSVDF
jgi:hypothetical protein